MSLIYETGEGLPDSESYASVVQADDYHEKRGNSGWAALETEQKEIALRKATDYITQSYRSRWIGSRSTATQNLDWPRQNAYIDDNGIVLVIENDEIPEELKNATCELAIRSLSGDLAPDIERETASESVGSISVSYFQGSKQSTTYKSIDMMLSPLLNTGTSNIELIRA